MSSTTACVSGALRPIHFLLLSVLLGLAAISAGAEADSRSGNGTPEGRAEATVSKMTPGEKLKLVSGIMPLPFFKDGPPIPADAIPTDGYVPGIPRLGVPALKETDASMGVSSIGGFRKDPATALPSGLAMASTWSPPLVERGGAVIGSETRAKGMNVMLAGGMNLMREPRGGRTFEYLGEDPLLAGTLAGAAVRGIQSNHIISTLKHFALNAQETARGFVDARISEAAARESDLLAFEIAIEYGHPGAIMCAYNKINGIYACDNDWLLNKVLKKDWGFKGFVMSDWGAVHSLGSALHGLDQQSGVQFDPKLFFGQDLGEAAAHDPRYAARLADMNRRILYSIYASGIDRNPPVIKPINFKADAEVAEAIADEGVVLLRNRGDILPVVANARKIAVIGGYSDLGMLAGGGGSLVQRDGAPVLVPITGSNPLGGITDETYWGPAPLAALRARAPHTHFLFRDGQYLTDAVNASREADAVIVFATEWRSEGMDVPDLSLPRGQDQLIEAVAAANPNTIVVLETGGPVLMPWLDKTAAVIEAWYPGTSGTAAITGVLYGDINPSGRLPVTFPASLTQLPSPNLPGGDWVEPDMMGRKGMERGLTANYNIEGSDVGYRWYSRQGEQPLFPFGYGLSYTTFAHSVPHLSGGQTIKASFTVKNTGLRTGADVPQLYLVSAAGEKKLRLLGWQKVTLPPGASKAMTVTVDPRLLAHWKDGGWSIAGGTYTVALGSSAMDLETVQRVTLSRRKWGQNATNSILTSRIHARDTERSSEGSQTALSSS